MIYDRNRVRHRAGFSGRRADRSARQAHHSLRGADRLHRVAGVGMHGDATFPAAEVSGRSAELDAGDARRTHSNEPQNRARTRAPDARMRRSSPPACDALIRVHRAACRATITADAHAQPIAAETKAIVAAANRTVRLDEPIRCSREAIDLRAPRIGSVPDVHPEHPVSPFGDFTNVIGNVGEPTALADDLTLTLGQATALRARAGATSRRVRWHRPRRPSAPCPSRTRFGDERTATGERSATLDEYEIANRGSLIATSRGTRFHEPGGHRHLI
jgi:hypothetical protein